MKLQPYAYTPTLQEIIDWLEGQPAEVAAGRLAHHEASQNEIWAGREIKKLREKCVEIAKQSKKDQVRREGLNSHQESEIIKALSPLVVLLSKEPGVKQRLKEILTSESFYDEVSKEFSLIPSQRIESAVDVMQGGARGGAGQGVLSGDVSHKGGDDSKDSTTPAA
jgi:hypothetical protein